jgi:hypothetical protein
MTRNDKDILRIDVNNLNENIEEGFDEVTHHRIDDGTFITIYPADGRVVYGGTPHEPVHKFCKFKIKRSNIPTIYTPGIDFADAKD